MNRNRLSEVIKKVDRDGDRVRETEEVGKEGTGGVRIRVPSKAAFGGGNELMLVGRDLPLSRLPIFALSVTSCSSSGSLLTMNVTVSTINLGIRWTERLTRSPLSFDATPRSRKSSYVLSFFPDRELN